MGRSRRTAAALLFLLLPLRQGMGAEAPRVEHAGTFRVDGAVRVHCACLATHGGCDGRLAEPVEGQKVHRWWQTLHVEKDRKVDFATACWQKRDAPGFGDALCCDARLGDDGRPRSRELKAFFGVSGTSVQGNR